MNFDISNLIPAKILALLNENKIQFCFCDRISAAAKHLNPILNDQGFSEEWDRVGLFSATTKTVYIADQGWEFDAPKTYSEERKEESVAHEVGHAVDLCLGRPSLSKEFKDAWEYDLAHSFPYSDESKPKILGRLMKTPGTGFLELWADFFQFALSGKYDDTGCHYFPKALEVFNKQCAALGIPTVSIVTYKEPRVINGRTLDVTMYTLSKNEDAAAAPLSGAIVPPQRPGGDSGFRGIIAAL